MIRFSGPRLERRKGSVDLCRVFTTVGAKSLPEAPSVFSSVCCGVQF